MLKSPLRRRGRPSKFGRPSRLVALTLPDEVVSGLRTFHPDLARAVVSLFEKRPPPADSPKAREVELVAIADRRSLIAINRAAFRRLPGVDIVPLSADQAFLALEPGRGLSDLELAVIDRLEHGTPGEAERRSLVSFRGQLRKWRRNSALSFHTRAIIVVENEQIKNNGPSTNNSPRRNRPRKES